MKSLVSTLLQRSTLMVASFILAISSLSVAMPLFLSQTANAIAPIVISTVPELCNAIDNQADGQTWSIQPGVYGLGQCNSIIAGGQPGWYMPITKNDITISGVGNPTIYGTGYTANGAWATQDLIAIFGNNVTINGLTLMPKVEPNKTIEVMGDSATIENVTITPNTLTDQTEYDNISDPSDPAWTQYSKTWGGSIYYNNATGTQTLSNVTINNGGVSVHSPGTTFNVSSLNLSYTSDVDWLNDYRFYVASPTSVINGIPSYTYHVNSTLDNFDSVLAAVGDPTTVVGTDTISLDSDLTTAKQITLTKPVTLNGNGNTISAGFNYTNNSNNSVIGITGATGVTINNLMTDGSGTTGLYGINVYESTDVNINDVTVKNNGKFGLNVNSSNVTVNNITTANNNWGGVDVDPQTSLPSVLTVNGTSAHSEVFADLYIDDTTKAQGVSIIDTNNQYSHSPSGIPTRPNDQVYKLKMVSPTNLRWLSHAGVTLGVYTNVNQVTPAWTAPVAGGVVDHYEYSYTSPTNSSWSTPSSFTGTSIPDQAFGGAGNNGVQGPWQFKVRTVGQTGNMSPWVESPVITYDKIAPTIPNITNPLDGAYFKTSPILNQWSASTDVLSGFSHYQIAYNYDDGHSFGGSTCAGLTMSGHSGFIGCRDLTATSRNHTPGLSEQGGVTIWVRSFDNAGNASDWSTPVHYTYDATLPSTTITNVAVSNGVSKIATINGVATDTNFNYYYCYVTGSGGEVGVRDSLCQTAWAAGTPFKTAFAPTVTGQSGGLIGSVDMSGLATGTYTAHLVAIDKAGNQSEATSTFDVDNTAPAAAITTTGTQSTATPTISGTVDADADTLVFTIDGVVQPITWALGDTTWTSTPATALSGGIHNMSIVATDAAGNEGGQTGTITISVPAPLITPLATTPGGGTGTPTPTPEATVTPGEVLGDQTTNEDAAKTDDSKANPSASILGDATSNPMNLFGLAWYWWLAILAAIIAAWWIIAAALRRRDNQNV